MGQRTSVVVDDGSIKIDRAQNKISLTFTVVGCFTPTTLSTLKKADFACVQPYFTLRGGVLAERWRLTAAGDYVCASAIMRAVIASVECDLTARSKAVALANTL